MSLKPFLYLLLFCCSTTFGQKNSYFWPIDTPRVITGNYGELRPNHFHAGIDFSTGGKTGLPVYAVADGYVSRVRVNPGAYGRAVYITHSGGEHLSLYAHFSAFAGALADYVLKEQQTNQSYDIELFPEKDRLKVRRGDLIGYSGNSGNSTGPHLHFELRDLKTEIPLNPLDYFMTGDTVAPELLALGFYNLSDTLHPDFEKFIPVKRNKEGLFLPAQDTVVLDHSVIGFAFSAQDRFVKNGNPNVVHAAGLFQDAQLIFSYELDKISFDDQRYMNEFAETIHRLKFQKCFLPTLYPALYPVCLNKGRILLTDTLVHELLLELRDESGNLRRTQIWIRTRSVTGFSTKKPPGNLLAPDKDQSLRLSGFRLFIPAYTLYYHFAPWVDNQLQRGSFFIHPDGVNLRNSFSLSFKVPAKWTDYQKHLVLENSGSFYVPEQTTDSVRFQLRNFGSYHLMVDSLAPQIKTQLPPKKIKRLRNFKTFNFIVRDNMSGIVSCNLFVNGQWVPAEYDAKNNLLIYEFAEGTPIGPLLFRVEATDRVGNRKEWTYKLQR